MGFLIALFSVSALVWVIPLLRSGRMTPLAMLVVITGIVFGPMFFTIDGPIQISLDRIAILALMGLLVVRWRMGELHFARQMRMDWLVAGMAGWFLIRVFEGDSGAGISIWLAYVAMPTAIYAVTRSTKVSDGDIRWIINAFLVLGFYLAVTGLFEVFNLHSFVFPRHIVDSEFSSFFGRARGPLRTPVANGMLMTITCIASILRFIHGNRRQKFVYAGMTLLMMAGVYVTLTRSVWVGAFLAICAISLFYAPRWVRILGLATSVLLGIALFSGFGDSLMQLKRDKYVKASDSARSVQLRPVMAVIAYEMFKDRPLMGHGYSRYAETSVPYHSIRGYDMPLKDAQGYVQHNVFLAILVDLGLVGLSIVVVWLALISAIGWSLASRTNTSLESRMLGLILIGFMTSYLVNGLFHDVSIMPMVHMVMFFIAGLATTLYSSNQQSVAPRRVQPALSIA